MTMRESEPGGLDYWAERREHYRTQHVPLPLQCDYMLPPVEDPKEEISC